ncbi:hypothetical protein V1477_006046 [Vespula maculifrons]|uniref:Uncharacterized protein n=3 Tax=Vespula TaxID=7451 RepID=A0A834KA03_VESPE|nr:hypothetical protein HZH66_013221 [Vespula vulgaris]KAF7400051.1 hypothetical protein H0235_015788 [Vespula pensylvanica]
MEDSGGREGEAVTPSETFCVVEEDDGEHGTRRRASASGGTGTPRVSELGPCTQAKVKRGEADRVAEVKRQTDR